MTFYSTIDEFGYLKGTIAATVVVDANRHIVVEAIPEGPTLPFTQWKWAESAWELAPDYRGHTWYDPEGINPDFQTDQPDVAPPSGWTYWASGESKQITASAALRDARLQKTALMAEMCGAHITAGFMSDALGVPHHYPAKQQDQANLTASVTDSLIPDLPEGWTTSSWCEIDGVWEMRPHTASQIQQVYRTGKAIILAAMQKNEQLRQQISTADAEQLATILW